MILNGLGIINALNSKLFTDNVPRQESYQGGFLASANGLLNFVIFRKRVFQRVILSADTNLLGYSFAISWMLIKNPANRMKTRCDQALAREISLDAYLDGIENLPPTPMVLIKLIGLFRQAHADVDDIVQLLRRDPALSAEVLRRCNNSLFGSDAPTKDVNEAVYRLGFYEVYQAAVLLFGMRVMSTKKMAPGFPVEELRRHSSIAAIAGGGLARRVGVSEGIAFTAGLLHDIGKLVMAIAEQDRYVELMKHCERAGTSLSKAEEKIFGFNHSQVGAQLLRRWEVPEEISAPVLGHTVPGELDSLTILTRSASELARHIMADSKLVFSATPQGNQLMNLLGLETDHVDDWEREVRSKVAQLGSLASE